MRPLLLPVVLALLAVTARADYFLPLDCSAIHERNSSSLSGVYAIYPSGPISPLRVYCDMESDGGGWTVFQRRLDGSVNFFRPWDAYKTGFGSVESEFWLGLENILLLTRRTRNELRVDMEDWDGNGVHAHYASFSLEPEANGYTMTLGPYVDGKAGDALKAHNGMKFSTYDKDQDSDDRINCASHHMGAFWYSNCHVANPNGVYMQKSNSPHGAIFNSWHSWKGHGYSLKNIAMKMRPVSHCSHTTDSHTTEQLA